MAYPLPTVRRRRRRRIWMVLTVAAVALLVAALAVRFISERRKVTDFLDAAREAAVTFDGLAVRADTLVGGLESADRASVLSVLGETVAEADAAEQSLAATEMPGQVVVPGGFLKVAVASWRAGLTQLHEGVVAVLDDPSDMEGNALLAGAFLNFRVGDRAYTQFLSAVLEVEEAADRTYPEFLFVPPELEGRYDAALVTERLSALERLTIQHDLAVADVRFDPAPTGDRSGRMVIPFSPSLSLEVTVVNRGNEPEANIPARLLLVGVESDLRHERTQTVEALEPGEAVTLTFPGLPVEPGQFYEVVLTVELEGDEDPSSNRYSESFYRNDAA